MNLKHHFLIAMPTLQDPLFKRSVVYICEHNEEGAMGLVINKPMENLTVRDILKRLQISVDTDDISPQLSAPVFIGGPMAEERGFILHSSQHTFSASSRISDQTMITTSRDILEALGTEERPEHTFVALGYSAWEKDQLEEEIMDNTWLTTPANNQLLFQTPISERWSAAAKSIGVNIYNIIGDAGHA